MNPFRRLLRKPEPVADPPEFVAPIAPEAPIAVIGDIHGTLHLLDDIIPQIADTAKSMGIKRYTTVFVGDLIDRGDASLEVLKRVKSLQTRAPKSVVCILGNHEKMMLEFLDNPEERGSRWLRNGGLQTLASFGVGGVTELSPPQKMREARDKLAAGLPKGMEAWLRQLPLTWRSGNVVVCHAGGNPNLSFDDQDERSLLWGHPEFFTTTRTDGNWVVHGHFVVETIGAERGRVNVDSGAVFTGQLTAAVIAANEIKVVKAQVG